MEAFTGLLGILALFGLAFLLSNNRSAINWRLVICGLSLQVMLALFILKLPLGQALFGAVGQGVEKLLSFADAGGGFVFGPLVSDPDKMIELFGPAGGFIFAFKLVPTIIFVSALVSIAYHTGLMQKVVKFVASLVYKLMGASGSEALSNSASVFVGQIEAQLLIKPYIASMTQSELLASMAGSMACIAGGVMAVYIQLGVPAEYLLAASLMAIPGALVISKIIYPETEASNTRGDVKLSIEKQSVNLIDAAARGSSEGLKIGLNVCAMLIGFIALIACADFVIALAGKSLVSIGAPSEILGLNLSDLAIQDILGTMFSGIAVILGVPAQDAMVVGSLMGTKMVVNEFVAYMNLSPLIAEGALDPKSVLIASFALCGFANFSSIAMQIGGIGEMAPSRKADLARLGLKAMICGTMASYVSAALAGVLMSTGESTGASYVLPLVGMAICAAILMTANKLMVKPEDENNETTSEVVTTQPTPA
ncbi:MAG: hypothetical protein KTR14_10950 [Vampirovibrio sp.]|nr:hypothetical protein [Vampirovibrio sp.]